MELTREEYKGIIERYGLKYLVRGLPLCAVCEYCERFHLCYKLMGPRLACIKHQYYGASPVYGCKDFTLKSYMLELQRIGCEW